MPTTTTTQTTYGTTQVLPTTTTTQTTYGTTQAIPTTTQVTYGTTQVVPTTTQVTQNIQTTATPGLISQNQIIQNVGTTLPLGTQVKEQIIPIPGSTLGKLVDEDYRRGRPLYNDIHTKGYRYPHLIARPNFNVAYNAPGLSRYGYLSSLNPAFNRNGLNVLGSNYNNLNASRLGVNNLNPSAIGVNNLNPSLIGVNNLNNSGIGVNNLNASGLGLNRLSRGGSYDVYRGGITPLLNKYGLGQVNTVQPIGQNVLQTNQIKDYL